MGTVRRLDDHRGIAVRRFHNGERARSIAVSLGRSVRWVYKWAARAAGGGPDWASDRSRRPHGSPQALSPDVVEAVQLVRLELYNAGLLCGAQNIQWRLEELAVTPLPSVRTIGRINKRYNEHLKILGIVATMFDGRTNLSHQVLEEIRRAFSDKVFPLVVTRSVRLSEAPSFGKPIIYYDERSAGADQYFKLSQEVLDACEKASTGPRP